MPFKILPKPDFVTGDDFNIIESNTEFFEYCYCLNRFYNNFY